MNDTEAFLLFLVYMLPFGGIGNIIYGITENDKSKIILGTVFIFISLFIMCYLIYQSREPKSLIANDKKTKLLVGMFREVIFGSVLMIAEFLILRHFKFKIRYIMIIICISFGIMTIIFSLFQKS